VVKLLIQDTSNAVKKYCDYILTGIKNGEDTDLLNDIRQSNKGKSDKNEYRCWVIGDREFVKKAIENDTSRRINLIEYQKKGITIETVAKDVSRQMGIEYRKIFHRSRSNEISALRKIVAVLSYRRYGIPLIQRLF
jgi:biotin synthase-related radical SAM superfamily protein